MAMAMAKSVAAVKSSVYSVQLSLLDGVSDKDKLSAAGKVLTQNEYADIVTERTIVDTCGYPLCTNRLPSTVPHKGRYHISLREHKVYDLQEARLFCSSDCLVASKSFAASLALEREHSTKTLELASAFHNLGTKDVDQQNRSSSLVIEKARPLIQELDEQCNQDTQISVDLPVPVENAAAQQPLQLNPGTFLLIREENEIKVTDVNAAGPSNAIEGYVPQKEFRASCHKQVSDQDKEKIAKFPSRHDSNDGFGNIIKKKEKREKAASASKFKQSARRASSEKEPKFTSCILVDHEEPAMLHDVNCRSTPASSCSELINGHTSHISMDKKVITHTGRKHLRRQNRVSWADHNNLNLVEELCHSSAASASDISKETCNLRVHEDNSQAMPDTLMSEGGDVSFKEGCGLLQRQEGFRVRKEQESTAGKCALTQTQESFCCRKDYEDIQGTMIHEKEDDQALMSDMMIKMNIAADPVGGSIASSQRQEHVDGREEPEIMLSIDSGNENLECAKALVAALTEAAEAVAHGEADSSEAVARAGISIVPSSHCMKEIKDVGKNQEDDDDENMDPRDCWYSAPPKDFKPELSVFGTLWMALDGWISATSIAHVYGKDSNEEDNFTFINGKEYLRQVIIPNGVSAEIERTLAGCISRTLPGLVETLRLPTPVSTLEVSLGRFLRTMSFMTAIPAFSSKQWQVVVLLLLDALSVHRLPALRTRFLNGRHSLQKVLASANITEAEYEIFRDLVLPMGMLPDFAAHCGG